MHNGIYMFCCLLTLFLLLFITWRSNRPGIITLCFVTQWTQVVTFVIWMNVYGVDINYLSKHGGTAVICSCIGLLVTASTITLGIKSLPVASWEQFNNQAKLINEKKLLFLYLYSTLFLGSLGLALGFNSGFSQILLTLSSVKWVFFLVLGYVSWINKKNRVLMIGIILFEFVSGFYSYFSSFKEVILYTIVFALTFIRNLSFKQFFYSMLAVVVLGFILLTWTSIKGEYRNFISNGKAQQVVEVSKTEAFGKIGTELSELTWEKYQVAINGFLYRLQYTLHMAYVMDRVPEMMPYEEGNLWWENISFVLKPRLFFPDKGTFDATSKTNKYTGLHFSGYSKGASFSIPYYVDGYIDFGYVGMFIPLILLGLYIVLIYRTFYMFKKLNLLIRFAFVNVVLYDFFSFEADGLYLFGRLTLLWIVFFFFSRFVFPRIQAWLYK